MPVHYFPNENYESKQLCILVVETSLAMSNLLQELKLEIDRFKREMLQDSIAPYQLEVAIVTTSKASVISETKLLPYINIPFFKAEGLSLLIETINEAYEIIDDRIQYYKSLGIPYYHPMIIVITNGLLVDPSQDIEGISKK